MAFSDPANTKPSGKQNDYLLISAIISNDLEDVKKWVEQGADVNASWPSDGHHSVFTKAVEYGNIDIVRYLLTKKAKLKQCALYNTYNPLVVAIRTSFSLPLVKLLVEKGAEVNERDISGSTPLNVAISLNKDSIVEYLLMNGADVDQVDGSGRLPITLSVHNNRFEIVKHLVLRGADINRDDSKNDNALTLSQRLTNTSILNYLEEFSQGTLPSYSGRLASKEEEDFFDFFQDMEFVYGTVEEREPVSFVKLPKSNTTSLPQKERKSSNNECRHEEKSLNENLLDQAILEDDLEKVKVLLQDKDINEASKDGFTPLARAIRFENIEIIKYLLTLNANISKGVNGKNPLLLAVEQENLEIVKLLLDHGAKDYIQTAFFEAINLENIEIINYFLQTGVEINVIYKNGYTPLTKSIEIRNFEIVKKLVENGANVNMPGNDGKLPLTISLELGDPKMASFLHSKGATCDASSFLQKYTESGNLEELKILVDVLNVNLDCVYDCGSSPLTKAVELENLEMVKYLVSRDAAAVNKVDDNSKTPLAVAAMKQNLPIVKFLISSGGDTNLATKEIEEFRDVCEDFALYLDINGGKYTQWK